MVIDLTDVFVKQDYPALNRDDRKLLECKRLANISSDAQTIKFCDLIDNSSTISEFGGGFAKVYLREKSNILKVLTLGDRALHERAAKAGI